MQVKVLSKNILMTTKVTVSASMVVEVTFAENSKPLKYKCIVEASVRSSAPQRRISRKLEAQAVSSTIAYFDGEDTECPNIFSAMAEGAANRELTAVDEQELQAELQQIEEEFSLVA